MRTLYHGSTEEIQSPLVGIGRKNLDFGEGFYLTAIRSQARTWAEIKSRYLFDATGIINEYVFDFEAAISEYRYKHFEHYDSEWLHFIADSRSGLRVWHGYDIIEGGVANDRVIDTVEAFIAGQIDEAKALGELSRHQPNNQVCILRQAVADKHLKFVKSSKLR